MSLYAYHVLEAVMDEGSFAKAAILLNLTPSAVSHTIAKLEQDFGFPLFIRTRNGVMLTENGEKMLPLISSMLHNNELISQEASQIRGLTSGTVRIGTFYSVTVNWLPPILKEFQRKYPGIEIKIKQGGYDDIIRWIKTNEVDLGFASQIVAENLDFMPLHRDRMVCVTAKDFQPLYKTYVVAEDIKNIKTVMQREGYDWEALEILKKYGLKVRTQFRIEDDNSIMAMVEAGFGIAILSELICKHSPFYDINIYPFYPNEYRTLGLISNHAQVVAPATEKLREEILQFVAREHLMNLEQT